VTSSVDVLEAELQVKLMYMIKSWLKTRKRENMQPQKFLHNSPPKSWFSNGIHSLLR